MTGAPHAEGKCAKAQAQGTAGRRAASWWVPSWLGGTQAQGCHGGTKVPEARAEAARGRCVSFGCRGWLRLRLVCSQDSRRVDGDEGAPRKGREMMER
jgi:hypothetical protein